MESTSTETQIDVAPTAGTKGGVVQEEPDGGGAPRTRRWAEEVSRRAKLLATTANRTSRRFVGKLTNR